MFYGGIVYMSNTILHIEDNFEYLQLTKTLIQKDLPDCEVTGVTSLDEACKMIDESEISKYNMIILDYEFAGGRTGLELLESLKRNGEKIPVVFLTCYADAEIREKAFKLGVEDYLHKYDYSHLRRLTDIIRNILNNLSRNQFSALLHESGS